MIAAAVCVVCLLGAAALAWSARRDRDMARMYRDEGHDHYRMATRRVRRAVSEEGRR